MTDTTTTDVALVELPKFNLPAPTEIAAKMNDSFQTIYTKIESEIAQMLGDLESGAIDIETKAHREKLKSLAYKISRTKTGLDESAAKLMAETKAMNDAVNSERKGMRETLDGLRDKAKKPAVLWDEKDAIRLQQVQEIVDELTNIRVVQRGDKLLSECTSAEINDALETMVATIYNGELLGDRREEVVFLHGEATAYLRDLLVTVTKRERDEKELAELRAANAERERIERERSEKEAADKAANEKVEWERIERERIEAEAVQKAAVAQAEILAKAEQEKADALAAVAREKAERIVAEKHAELERKADAKHAEENRIAAEKKAEQDKKDAREQAERDKAFAIQEEKNRQLRILESEREARDMREADLVHRKKINNAVLAGIIAASDVGETEAKMIVQAIAKGHVPHVKINY